MSKLSKAVEQMNQINELRLDEAVENFMGGTSYEVNPLDILKMVTASSIMGEPSYYRDGRSSKSGLYKIDPLVADYVLLDDKYNGKKTDEIMEIVIDNALSYNFKETLEWAVDLRKEFYMRLNPQVIMVRAAIHPNRKKFTEEYPGLFNELNQKVMSRADEAMSQMAYYLYKNKGKKNNIPSVIKRSWSENLSKLNKYKVAKYKNHEIGMINAVRLCHAHSAVLDELMKNGTVEVSEDDKTWENLRSAGKGWKTIFSTIDMGHMALLRNLRNVFEEVDDIEFCKEYVAKLKDTVISGKQFPFRYYTAIEAVKKSKCKHQPIIIDALEDCMDISMENYPRLKGKTMCLSDNSGSAWGAFTSEYGSVTVANIDNLSSVMTAAASDEGYVGTFGDRLVVEPISKRRGVLSQAEDVNKKGKTVGGSTEGGIWLFFKQALENKEHWDNIFIYSDMQAGHGGLYGTSNQCNEYRKLGFNCSYNYINVFKLIQEYRKKVNPKVNVFCIQTAGYNNVLIPEMAYRTAIMYGWTGKEAQFAQEYIKQWDEIESRKQKQQNKNQ